MELGSILFLATFSILIWLFLAGTTLNTFMWLFDKKSAKLSKFNYNVFGLLVITIIGFFICLGTGV